MSRWTKLFLGLAIAACLFGVVETGARILLGDPPVSGALWKTTRCSLAERGGQSWIECRWVHGKEDRWAVLESPKAKTKPRVVVLGGSSVYNSNDANPHVNFPSALQRLLPDVEVINLGTPGMDSAGVLWMSEQSKKLDPDLLVVYTGHNDFSEIVFTGGIRGTRLWFLPVERVLSKSWIYAGLALRQLGSVPVPRYALGAENPDHPAICPKRGEEVDLFVGDAGQARMDRRNHWMAGMNRKAVIPVEDRTAFQVRGDLLQRLEDNLRSLVINADVPVVMMTLMRNFDHVPSGVLVSQRERCRRALGCLTTLGGGLPKLLLEYSQATCGESSITSWLESLIAREEGDTDKAVQAFYRSLDLDPLPLRAPQSADQVIRKVSQEMEMPLVDVSDSLGPVLPGEWFTDNLHLSAKGTWKVAEVLAPVVDSALAP
jgi:lysophospholipase L1-like esterase